MGCYVDPTGSYYEGDRMRSLDAAVPQRPSAFHTWDFPTAAWVLVAAGAAAQADAARLTAVDGTISAAQYGNIQPATVAQLKAMDNPTFAAWFDANVTNAPAPAAAAIQLLKHLTRIIIRRVL